MVAEARREVAAEMQPVCQDEPASLDEQLDAACLELRGWAKSFPRLSASEDLLAVTVAELRELSLHNPQQAELTSLLQECQHTVSLRKDHASGAPVETSVLTDTVSELRALCESRPGDEALESLMRECTAESDRRESLSRPPTAGKVAATEMQIARLVDQAGEVAAAELQNVLLECKREINGQKSGRRQRQRSPRISDDA